MSMVSESQPAWAMVSAEKTLGMASQPLTAAWPCFQIVLIRFSRIVVSRQFRSARAAYPGGRVDSETVAREETAGLAPAHGGRKLRPSMSAEAACGPAKQQQKEGGAMKLYMHPASTTSRAVMLFLADAK